MNKGAYETINISEGNNSTIPRSLCFGILMRGIRSKGTPTNRVYVCIRPNWKQTFSQFSHFVFNFDTA